MSLLSMILSLAFLMPGPIDRDEKALLRVAQNAEVVVVAEVIEVRPSLGFWSGVMASVQHVRYKVVEVLRGNVKSSEIDAGHYVVASSLTADKGQPRLSPELFKPGNRLVLLLSRDKGYGCKLENPEGDIEAFCSPSENYGATLASSKLTGKIRRALKEK